MVAVTITTTPTVIRMQRLPIVSKTFVVSGFFEPRAGVSVEEIEVNGASALVVRLCAAVPFLFSEASEYSGVSVCVPKSNLIAILVRPENQFCHIEGEKLLSIANLHLPAQGTRLL